MLLQVELAPNTSPLPPASAVPFCCNVSEMSDALARRIVALTVAASTIVALMTGLNSRPFFSIELPRWTKLLFDVEVDEERRRRAGDDLHRRPPE